MQMVLKVIKPRSSVRTPTLLSLFSAAHVCSALCDCGENQQCWMATKAGLCSRCAFVIRDTPGKEASWGNILQARMGWNWRFLTEFYLFHQLPSVSLHQHARFLHTYCSSLVINSVSFEAPHIQLQSEHVFPFLQETVQLIDNCSLVVCEKSKVSYLVKPARIKIRWLQI